MDMTEKFQQEVQANIDGLKRDRDMQDLSRIWLRDTLPLNLNWNSRSIV